MYPLFLIPSLKNFIWGGHRLPEEYGYKTELEQVAEAWVLSCHPQGSAVVADGELAGMSLPAVLAKWGDTALGEKATVEDFPLLIKLIDARDRLSVQVHPDDEYARRVEGEQGKTEMWYILDCEPGAQLLYGVNTPLTKEEFRCRIQENTLEEIGRYVPVKKGDVFFIPAGTLHAIGGGILLAEVQQNSATTYRVSDYGRLGADGKPRPLHIDKALDVTRLTPSPLSTEGLWRQQEENGVTVRLAECDRFIAEYWQVSGRRYEAARKNFCSLLCLEGDGILRWEEGAHSLRKGDSVFIPAGVAFTVEGYVELLVSSI